MKKYRYQFLKTPFFFFILLAALVACEDEEENLTYRPGNQLFVSGAGTVHAGAESVRYFVENNTLDKNYTWTISGGATFEEDPDNEAFIYVAFPNPGTYEVSVSNGETEGSVTVEANPKVVSWGLTSATSLEYYGNSNDTIRLPVAITDPDYENANPATSTVTIHYTISGSATEGVDYELLSPNPLVIPKGDADDVTIDIKLLDDMELEENDSIVVTLTDVLDEAANNGTIMTDSVEMTTYIHHIMDDIKTISFESTVTDTLRTGADAGNYAFVANLSSAALADVIVPYTISGAGIGSAQTELRFPKGSTSQLLTVYLDETAFDSDQELTVTLGEPVSDDKEVMLEEDEAGGPMSNEVRLVVALDE